MDEFLLRAKEKPTKKWIYGTGITDFVNVYPDRIGRKYLWCNYGWIEVYPETISQYIGTDDFDGIKIFGDDIVKPIGKFYETTQGVVVFKNQSFCVDLNKGRLFYFHEWDIKWEIIGNIHDNPELLK